MIDFSLPSFPCKQETDTLELGKVISRPSLDHSVECTGFAERLMAYSQHCEAKCKQLVLKNKVRLDTDARRESRLPGRLQLL